MRNYTIDAMKGVGIVLVVLYHAMGKNSPDIISSYDNGLFNMIACFFMQMFMTITGYMVYGKVGKIEWTKRNLIRWIIPLLSFLVIYWVWYKIFPNMIMMYDAPFGKHVMFSLLTGFSGIITWYIWCLMLFYIVACGVEKIRKKYDKLPVLLVVGVLFVFVNLLPVSVFGLLVFKWYMIFFFLGYLIRHYRDTIIIRIGGKVVYVSLVLFPLLGYSFSWLIPYQDINYGHLGLGFIYPAITNREGILVGIMILMAIMGIGFVYSLIKIAKGSVIKNTLSYLGRVSIGIYLLHIMFVGIGKNYWISAILALLLSLTIYEGLKRISVINKYLFGWSPSPRYDMV